MTLCGGPEKRKIKEIGGERRERRTLDNCYDQFVFYTFLLSLMLC